MRVSTNEDGSMELVVSGNPLQHLVLLSNVLSIPKILACPADERQPATSFSAVEAENISYFVGVDASEKQPQTVLAGDRNLTTNTQPVRPGLVHLTTNAVVGWTTEMHNLVGNVAMGDGSVQQTAAQRLAELLSNTGLATNRLAVP